jgi:hypothetical protein
MACPAQDAGERRGKMGNSEKIIGVARVIRTGFACKGVMPWESRYIDIEVYDNENSDTFKLITWHSELCGSLFFELSKVSLEKAVERGCWFDIEVYVRGDMVWRMKKLEYR